MSKSIATRIDWNALSSKLKPDTIAALNSFRSRHSELTKTISDLKEHQATINFDAYRAILSNKAVVDEAERALKAFKPATFDLTEQIRIIDQQEAKA
ncbi:ATP synthase d subunit, partial [Nowakowskiella sp. JEL0078]